MTEAAWLAQPDPKPLLKYLRRRWSCRKVRLFVSEAVRPLFDDFFRPFFQVEELAALPRELDLWVNSCDHDPTTPTLKRWLSQLGQLTGGYIIDLARVFRDSDWLSATRSSTALNCPTDGSTRPSSATSRVIRPALSSLTPLGSHPPPPLSLARCTSLATSPRCRFSPTPSKMRAATTKTS